MNNRLVITILTVVSALFLYGCQNDHNTQESVAAPGETLTLRDIQPTMVQEEPEKMIIRAIIYEMPASNIKYLTEVYEAISKQQLRFSDLDVFEENGFVAGLAPEPVWPVISNALHRASAQNILTNNLLFLESSSNDVYAMSTYNRQSFYLHKKKL